ncbi:DinB family protein [Niabella sp. CC-SYL272]|uniref:DinB family protein n=1 Tax=Niabella agricola TaxID=2891571 RepID=UPI001F40FE0A|nr:DinB family protein [Niabella agricola]MCF3109305.1 DinB family protein [Niabella agricola]
MEQSVQLAKRFREVHLNGDWVAATNLKATLSGLDWQQATTRIGTLNTIAALAFHINYYIAGILNVFEGGTFDIHDRFSFDAPPIRSQEDWEQLLTKLWADAERFSAYVAQLTPAQLDAAFTDEKYGTWQRNIDAMIEHVYYHLGQIVLLGKLVQQTAYR